MKTETVKAILEQIDKRIAKEDDKTDSLSRGYVLGLRHCRGMIEREMLDDVIADEKATICKS